MSPEGLASGYLAVRKVLGFLMFVRGGATLHTPDGIVNSSNHKAFGSVYRERVGIYTAAINQRGFGVLAGTYWVRRTKVCQEVPSLLATRADDGTAENHHLPG